MTVCALKNLLSTVNITSSGKKRPELINLCIQNNLITEVESITTKNKIESRRAWMIMELAKVDCNLRTDSKLCDAFINDGIGNPMQISAIMEEMQFYHTFTDYASIRDQIHQDAEDEYEDDIDKYGRSECGFHEYFNAEDASESAKTTAFEIWVQSKQNMEQASQHPELPITLKKQLVYQIGINRMKTWIESRFNTKATKAHGFDITRGFLQETNIEEMTVDTFEMKFYAVLLEHEKRELCKDRLQIKVQNWMGSTKSTNFAKHVVCKIAQTVEDLEYVDVITDSCKDFFESNYGGLLEAERERILLEETSQEKLLLDEEVKRGLLIAPSLMQVVQTMIDSGKMMRGHLRPNNKQIMRSISALRNKERYPELNKKWKCRFCDFTGCAEGVWAHSFTKHARKAREI